MEAVCIGCMPAEDDAAGAALAVSARALFENGFENGVSVNRMVSELQAAAALPTKLTRAIRDTATQCPEPTR